MEQVSEEDVGRFSGIVDTIMTGNSVADLARSFARLPYPVCFQLTVENYTNQHLDTHQNKIHSGHVSSGVGDN